MINPTPSAQVFNPPGFPRKILYFLGWGGVLMLILGVGFLNFDLVAHAEGVVEGLSMVRIHAPRSARIAEIVTRSGADVREGEVLFVLEDGDLERDLREARQRLVDVETERSRAELRLRELELVGVSFEAHVSKDLLSLRQEELALLEEVEQMYRGLREAGSGSRMEEIQFALRSLSARQLHRREQLREELEEAGWLDLLKAREGLEIEAAGRRAALLRETIARLGEAQSRLTVRAPQAGRITRVRFRDVDASVAKGEHLLSLYQPEAGYVARMVVSDRNVDLIRPGLQVRMDSNVFAASAEGYIYGTVRELIRDEEAPVSGGFEVEVSLERSPVNPVIGSRIQGEILLQRQGWLGLLRQKPLRETRPSLPGGEKSI